MNPTNYEHLRMNRQPVLNNATLVLALSGWMDGGEVSTGTVRRLVDLLKAEPFAEIDPDPFYLYSFPGSMEIAALFRPHIKIDDGLVVEHDMPSNTFFDHKPGNLVFFIGKEPNLCWRAFGDCVLELARKVNVRRILFIGSFGGPMPHTREPRLYVTSSSAEMLPEMERFGLRRRGNYEGPGSFATYLLTRSESAGVEMASIVAEIPGYLDGRNPVSIEAVTRRLAKILQLPLDLQALRAESTEWEMEVSQFIGGNKKLAKTIRELEEAYDNDLLEREGETEL
jgi:proteasome assembly chaperone (PAC2) family protein